MNYFLSLLLAISFGDFCQAQNRVQVIFMLDDYDSHKAIDGALVTVRQTASTKPTGIGGKVVFSDVPEGEIEYFVMKEGYQLKNDRVNVSRDEKTNIFRVSLSKIDDKKILIIGEVNDAEGRDVKDAIVEVRMADVVKSVKTDESGNYSLDIIPNKQYPVNVLRMEVKKGNCKKTENIEMNRTNIVYKDIKLDCNSPLIEIDPNTTNILGETFKSGAKFTIERFEQRNHMAFVYFRVENTQANDAIKDFSIETGYCKLMDQDGNSFNGEYCKIGNLEGGIVQTKLINGSALKGYVQFNISNIFIKKISYLKITAGLGGYGVNFELTNLPISK